MGYPTSGTVTDPLVRPLVVRFLMLPMSQLRPSQILEARKLLTASHDVSKIAQWIQVPKEIVVQINHMIINERVITPSELHWVSNLFQFNQQYQDLVYRTIGPGSREYGKALREVRDLPTFVLTLHRLVGILADQKHFSQTLLPVPAFLHGLFSLPRGSTLIFSVKVVIGDAICLYPGPLRTPHQVQWWAIVQYLDCLYSDQPRPPQNFTREVYEILTAPHAENLDLTRGITSSGNCNLHTDHDRRGHTVESYFNHPLENFFGLLHQILHNCNKFEEFLHAAARNLIVNEIFHELGHPRDICGRENQGGVMSRTSGKTIPDP